MDLKSFFKSLQSEKYAKLIHYLGALLIALVIFAAGVFVGDRKAEFSYRWSDNYYRDFGGSHSPFGSGSMMAPGMGDMNDAAPTPHGAFGTVIGVNMPSFAVKGPNEAEKVVIVSPGTVIHYLRNPASTTDIKVGQSVIIIGEPDGQGQINASFIRIVPPPPAQPADSSSTDYR